MTTVKHLTVGKRIRAARAEADWTQQQLSDATAARYGEDKRVPQNMISRYEGGTTKPTAETSDRLFTCLSEAGATLITDALDGVLGVQARSGGKLGVVRDLMAPPVPKDWCVTGFLAKRYVTILAGQEGAGKSTVGWTVAVALANGDDEAFGFRLPGKAQRVLIVDVENVIMFGEDEIDASLVTERLQHIGLSTESQENVTVVGCLGFDLDKDSDALDGILADAETEGRPYDFVMFDSFRSLWTSGSENTPEAGRVLTKIVLLAARHNVAVLMLHHQNKSGAVYSGHTSIGSTVAAVWSFSRLIHKSPETGKKEQHPTLRYLAPYKVRIAAELQSRIVSVGKQGITSAKTAEDYAGYEVDTGEADDAEGEGA